MLLKSAENSYVIFGEAKFLDFSSNLANDKVKNWEKGEEAKNNTVKQEEAPKPQEVVEEGDEDDNEDAGGIPEDKIATLMEYSSCSRARAIRALKKTDGDVV